MWFSSSSGFLVRVRAGQADDEVGTPAGPAFVELCCEPGLGQFGLEQLCAFPGIGGRIDAFDADVLAQQIDRVAFHGGPIGFGCHGGKTEKNKENEFHWLRE